MATVKKITVEKPKRRVSLEEQERISLSKTTKPMGTTATGRVGSINKTKTTVKKKMKCGGAVKKAQNGGTAAVTSFVPKTKADSISANQMANYRNIRAMGNSKSSGSKEKGTLPATKQEYDSLRAKQKGKK